MGDAVQMVHLRIDVVFGNCRFPTIGTAFRSRHSCLECGGKRGLATHEARALCDGWSVWQHFQPMVPGFTQDPDAAFRPRQSARCLFLMPVDGLTSVGDRGVLARGPRCGARDAGPYLQRGLFGRGAVIPLPHVSWSVWSGVTTTPMARLMPPQRVATAVDRVGAELDRAEMRVGEIDAVQHGLEQARALSPPCHRGRSRRPCDGKTSSPVRPGRGIATRRGLRVSPLAHPRRVIAPPFRPLRPRPSTGRSGRQPFASSPPACWRWGSLRARRGARALREIRRPGGWPR